MKKKEIQKFVSLLNEEKARLLSHTDRPEATSQDDLPDEVDLASSELNQAMDAVSQEHVVSGDDNDRTVALQISGNSSAPLC